MHLSVAARLSLSGDSVLIRHSLGTTASMTTVHRSRALRSIALSMIAVLTGTGLSGCAAVGQRISEISNAVVIHASEYHDLSRIRKESARQLAEERNKEREIAA